MGINALKDRIHKVSARVLYSLALAVVSGLNSVSAGPTDRAVDPGTVFARVGDTVITQQEFSQTLQRETRQRFYHFQPPADQADAFRREVAENLVTRVLLLQEAKRRGLEPNDLDIQEQLDGYAKRYADRPRWEQEGGRLMASLKVYLEQQDRLQQLERQVREVAPPSEAQLLEFYRANPDKFTEPAQHRVSVILLKVDPSASGEVWKAAEQEGAQLVKRLRGGADFAELAALHSGDNSAQNGGDMGYLHTGMLTAAAEAVLEKLDVGAVSDPTRMLEGVAIFRIEDRKPASLHDFAAVRARAQDLWVRERGEEAWETLKQRLRASTPIEVLDPSLSPG